MESADLVIIGAGWHGIAALRTYLQIHPLRKVIVLDAASSVGGVWAQERLYKGLKTQNALGTYEFSDFRMTEELFGIKPGQHIPDKIRLNHRVTHAEYVDKQWVLTVSDQRDMLASASSVKTPKLIMATGLTSQPFLPDFKGKESFEAPLFHSRDLAAHEQSILNQGQRVTVLGGTKSAWDTVYAFASSGIQVDWVIRESGNGPAWMTPAFVTPLRLRLEKLATTRLLTLFSPCIWGNEDGFQALREFLHGTWLGQKLVDSFWTVLTMEMSRVNRYQDHPETEKLRPWIQPFWCSTSISILNYPTDFFEYVKDGTVRVHVADIDHLSSQNIHLSTGDTLDTSALVCCTGWEVSSEMNFSSETDLGFPGSPDVMSKEVLDQAHEEILLQFPRLKDQPSSKKAISPRTKALTSHPTRLTRFMVPPSMLQDHSIVFLGNLMTFTTPLLAEVQALWAAAYLDDRLAPSSPITAFTSSSETEDKVNASREHIMLETALHTEFGRLRYPGEDHRNPHFAFDILPYLDLLLKDLGLSSRRKASLWAHLMESHGQEDYAGLIQEWKEAHREVEK